MNFIAATYAGAWYARIIGILTLGIIFSNATIAQYSQEVQSLRAATDLYDERGYGGSGAVAVDGRLIVGHANGSLSYSYPIVSTSISGYPFQVSLNYCSMGFTAFKEYETGNVYEHWSQFHQSRPAWIVSCNGFAVGVLSSNTMFHSDPSRFLDVNRNTYNDSDFVWTVDGWDVMNRMEHLPTASQSSKGYVDHIRILRGDGSILELINRKSFDPAREAARREDLYTGYYFENAANTKGFALVTYDDLDNWSPPAKLAVQRAVLPDTLNYAPYRPRILRYFPGDGLCYRFKEWPHAYGMNAYDGRVGQPDRFGNMKAGPTIFYLESIESNAGPIIPEFKRTRHRYPFIHSVRGEIEDTTVGRALITGFGDVRIGYGDLGMTIEAYGRTTKVNYELVHQSGNGRSRWIPLATRGAFSSVAEGLAKLNQIGLASTALYESYLAQVTRIEDAEGRVTTFEYEPYTRNYNNYNFPRSNPPLGQNLTLTLKNYRLNKVIEPTAFYTISYAPGNFMMGGTALRVDNVRNATLNGIVGMANVDINDAFYQNNVVSYLLKYDRNGTPLTTQECEYMYTPQSGFFMGRHRLIDHQSGLKRTTQQDYSYVDLTEPFAALPKPRFTRLTASHDSAAVVTVTATNYVQSTASKYLWLPSMQTSLIDGIAKTRQTFSYDYDTARTYGGDVALAGKFGIEVKRMVTTTVDPSTNIPILVDTTEYIHLPLIDVNLPRIDTIYNSALSHENYKRLLQHDSIHLPWENAMFDSRVAVYDIDTIPGRNTLPPLYGLTSRVVTANNSGILGGKMFAYAPAHSSPQRLNDLYGRGMLTSDTIIGQVGVAIPGASYTYVREGGRTLLGATTNANGASQRFAYADYISPKLAAPGGGYRAAGTIAQNDNTKRDTVLPHSGYFALAYEKPLLSESHIRRYDPWNTMGQSRRDTMLTMSQYTYHGIPRSTIDPNGNLSQFEHDRNGRLLTMWSPFDFPSSQTSDSVSYQGEQRIPLYGSSRAEYKVDTVQCADDGEKATRIDGGWYSTTSENLVAAWPVTEIPDCPCGEDLNALMREKERGHGIANICSVRYAFQEFQTVTGLLPFTKDTNSPLRHATSIDEIYLELHPKMITGECVTVNISTTRFGLTRNYLFNCDSVTPGFQGEIAGDGALRVDLGAIASDLMGMGTGYPSGALDFEIRVSTVGGGIEFVNGGNAEDTRPAIVVKGAFRKPLDNADYTLAYTYNDDSLKATTSAKVDDILHTANGYDLIAMDGETIRRTTATHYYGGDGRVMKSEKPIMERNNPGHIERIDSLIYGYTGAGARTWVQDQEGDTTATELDASGRPVAIINADGTRTTIAYTIGEPDDFGFTNGLDQDFHGFVAATTTTNENGVKFTQYHDAFDKLRREVADSGDPAQGDLNLTTRYNYDAQLRLTEVVNPEGDTTFYWYDSFGRVRQKYHPDLGAISYTYDNLNNIRFTQNQEQANKGRIGFNQYDDLNRVTVIGEAVIGAHPGDPLIEDDGVAGGWLRGKVYTADGKIIGSTKGEDEASILTGPVTRVTDMLDGTTLKLGTRSNTPPVTANPTLWETPQQGVPSVWNLSQTIYRFCSLQPDSFLLETGTPPTPLFRHPVTFHAAPYTPVATMADFEDLAKYPHFARIVISYDTLPHRAGSVWANFPSYVQWDSLMPKRKVRNTKGRETAIAYREHGGEPWHYQVLSYDERGRLEALVRWTENIGFDGVYYSYNSMNQVTSIRVADFYRQYQTWYGFDANGRVDSVWTKLEENVGLVPGPFTTSTWRLREELARPDRSAGNADSADIVYTYTRTGRIDSMNYPRIGVLVDYAYNHRKWLDSITSTQNGADLWKEVLTYDPAGQIIRQRSEHGGMIPAPDQHYSYDNIQRLTRWRMGTDTTSYSYDAVGNRTLSTRKVEYIQALNRNTTSMYGGAAGGPNRLLSAITQDDQGTIVYPGQVNYSYDANGGTLRKQQQPVGVHPSQKWEYVYSYRGMMRRIAFGKSGTMENEMRYRYSPKGEREQKRTYYATQNDSVVNYPWVYYLLGAGGEQLAVYHGQQTRKAMCGDTGRRVYMYPAEYLTYGIGGNANLTTLPTHERRYVLADHLGSARVVLDSGGMVTGRYDYEPFGEPMLVSGAVTGVRKSYIDKERDMESGLTNTGVRQKDGPRFLSVDPLWEKYQAWSPYVYSQNDPVGYRDVNGKELDVTKMQDKTVSQFRLAPNYYVNMLIEELSVITGLTLKVVNGKIVYDPNAKVSGGSAIARTILKDVIDSKDKTYVSVTKYQQTGIRGDVNKVIVFNPAQTSDFETLGAGVECLTNGWGMGFFHEYKHTELGGGYLDPLEEEGRGVIGMPDIIPNLIRQELGPDWGERLSYWGYDIEAKDPYIYYPFMETAQDQLRRRVKPASGYLKLKKTGYEEPYPID